MSCFRRMLWLWCRQWWTVTGLETGRRVTGCEDKSRHKKMKVWHEGSDLKGVGTIKALRMQSQRPPTQIPKSRVVQCETFICLGSKITTDGNWSHEIKRCLLPGRKAMPHLDSILKSRDITLPTKVGLIKAMVFPAVMYGCESWTIKKAEHWRIDAFELWCWRRLLRVPWTARNSN